VLILPERLSEGCSYLCFRSRKATRSPERHLATIGWVALVMRL
jgi:hypothetical protein